MCRRARLGLLGIVLTLVAGCAFLLCVRSASAQVPPYSSNWNYTSAETQAIGKEAPMSGPSGSPGADFLDTGIVFRGPVTFERGNDFTTFMMFNNDEFLWLKVNTSRAFSAAPNTSMSRQLAQKLTRVHTISIRVANLREDLPTGTSIAADLVTDVVVCLPPSLYERTETESFYTLECVAFNERQQVQNDAGDLFAEVGFVLAVPNHSTADVFLSQPREKVIYVRLEAGT